MIVYHGSNCVVKDPIITASSRLLDFGAGFYTTTNKEQAERWAEKVSVRRETKDKLVSIYEVDEKYKNSLKILTFNEPSIDWLRFVCACRSGKNTDIEYDMVIGPVADDNVFLTVSLFERGILDEAEALKRLKVESLFNQTLFHTQKALELCKYIGFYALGGQHG